MDDNRSIFIDEFIAKRNFLISSVDDISSRKDLDDIGTFFDKIYINSGSEGTKANSGIFYLIKIICLNNLSFKENIITICTLKLIPIKFEHCIEFAKLIFNT